MGRNNWEMSRLDDILAQALACEEGIEVECIDANKAASLRFALFRRKKGRGELPEMTISLRGAKVFLQRKMEEEEGILAVRAIERERIS